MSGLLFRILSHYDESPSPDEPLHPSKDAPCGQYSIDGIFTGWGGALLLAAQGNIMVIPFQFMNLIPGVLEGTLVTLVEVAAVADKYQVDKLHQLCTEACDIALSPETACQARRC